MKPWKDKIESHIDYWSDQIPHLKWWPKFVYHFTSIQNALNILETGKLYSRRAVIQHGLMLTDNASPTVIAKTKTEHQDFVRLYFRPRTPTQYNNEGIRPSVDRPLGGAHCDVPIFFCFGAQNILSLDDANFSNGNMGSSQVKYGDTLDFFESIPFEYVFHNGKFSPELRDAIVFHRNAEILLPQQLDLEHLKWLVCRSAAERQMFLYLLPIPLRRQWHHKIRLSEQGFFERKWTYIEEVVAVGEQIIFRFNPNTLTSGPFSFHFEYTESTTAKSRVWNGKSLANDVFRINIPNAVRGKVSLYLDGVLAFQDMILFKDIPF